MTDTAASTEVDYAAEYPTLKVRRDGHVLVMGLNRPDKLNAFDSDMLRDFSLALAELDEDPQLWAGVVYGEGRGFTSGLDLSSVAPALARGESLVPPRVSTPGSSAVVG